MCFKENLLISFNSGGNLERNSDGGLDGVRLDTAAGLMGVLSSTESAEQAREATLNISGREVSVEKIANNLQSALKLVHSRMGHLTGDLDLSKMDFDVLEGNIVARSTETKMIIDPVMLLHPALRLAYAIAHESLHHGTDVANEDLVDAIAKEYFADSDLVSVYDSGKMKDFAKISALSLEEIRDMYLVQDFKGLYASYKNGYLKHSNVEIDSNSDNFDAGSYKMSKDAAIRNFRDLFPELTFVKKPGDWTSNWSERMASNGNANASSEQAENSSEAVHSDPDEVIGHVRGRVHGVNEE